MKEVIQILCHCLGLFPRQVQFPEHSKAQQSLKLTFSLYTLSIPCFKKRERCASPKQQPGFAVIST